MFGQGLGIQRRRLADLQPQRKFLASPSPSALGVLCLRLALEVGLLTAPGGPRHSLVDRLKAHACTLLGFFATAIISEGL